MFCISYFETLALLYLYQLRINVPTLIPLNTDCCLFHQVNRLRWKNPLLLSIFYTLFSKPSTTFKHFKGFLTQILTFCSSKQWHTCIFFPQYVHDLLHATLCCNTPGVPFLLFHVSYFLQNIVQSCSLTIS